MMPCGLCAAVPVIKPTSHPQECDGSQCKKLVRPSELPLYTAEQPLKPEPLRESSWPLLEEKIHNIRLSIESVIGEYRHVTDSFVNTIDTGIAHTKSSIDFLRDEENLVQRTGAIFGGGLVGLLLGVRGGKFKKLLYTSTGSGLVASTLYPKEAAEAFNLATYYANIAYNFAYGVKPSNENDVKLGPKFPQILSEFFDGLKSENTESISSSLLSMLDNLLEIKRYFSETVNNTPENTKNSDGKKD